MSDSDVTDQLIADAKKELAELKYDEKYLAEFTSLMLKRHADVLASNEKIQAALVGKVVQMQKIVVETKAELATVRSEIAEHRKSLENHQGNQLKLYGIHKQNIELIDKRIKVNTAKLSQQLTNNNYVLGLCMLVLIALGLVVHLSWK